MDREDHDGHPVEAVRPTARCEEAQHITQPWEAVAHT